MADINIGQLAATTLQNYRGTLEDNIFKNRALLDHMLNNGGVEEEDGGRSIVVPLMYGANSTVMPFSGADALDVTPQEGIDAAEYAWKMYNVSIVITKEEELKNRGKSAVIKLIKGKIMQAENSLKERLADDMFNGAASNTKEITGLQTAVDTGTYGGIAGGTYTFWQSYKESTATALTVAQIRTMKNTVNNGSGGGKCSIMVTTQALFEKYESLLTGTITYNNPFVPSRETKRLLDAGFSGSQFGGVPIVYDEQCPSGEFYALNTENLKLTVHKDARFTTVNPGQPTAQHVSVQHIMVMLNTTVNRRASLGKLTAKTV